MRHHTLPFVSLVAALALLGAGCVTAGPPAGGAKTPPPSAGAPSTAKPNGAAPAAPTNGGATTGAGASGGVDLQAIPLGDGKVSTSAKAGYVYSCVISFNGGGADHAGDWISGNTWDETKKIHVQGSVTWPDATFSVATSGATRAITGNGLPVGEPTGLFPIKPTDPAYQYDRNPNSVRTQDVKYDLPADPTVAASPTCVPMGPVGVALDGVAIYNALDADGRDAVAHEVQDSCNGHPQSAGQYHYHGPSDCMPHAKDKNALVGYALDGFGIYSKYDANGNEYTDADLDECHGITSEVEWDGKMVNMYHYVLTDEYPYTVGCFRGAPITGAQPRQQAGAGAPTGGAMQQPPTNGTAPAGGAMQPPPQGGPPPAAISACSGKADGAACAFIGAKGDVTGTCRTTPDGAFACVP